MKQSVSKDLPLFTRHDLTDFEWDFIKAVLPHKSRGVPRVDDRRVLNGIFYILRTGTPWRDLPRYYGPYTTVYNRFNRWSKKGIWDDISEAIIDANNHEMVMQDSTSIRVHHAGATLSKNDPERCMGRSRGGTDNKNSRHCQ